MADVRKIVFLTGTRADFGKLKSLIQILEEDAAFEVHIFVTGMHLMPTYGETIIEINRCGFTNVSSFKNFTSEATMDLTLAKTIEGFSPYIKRINPDLIVVHGDRVEALAGATVGALNNVLVAHIEGGELSGTIDELIRHSVSKLSHLHYVSNEAAQKRLIQMGELPRAIKVIGSPDVDIMFSQGLPDIAEVKSYYDIRFESYAVCMFHPVTTEVPLLRKQIYALAQAMVDSRKNYLVIYPNNDHGSSIILEAYKELENLPNFRILPSLRFEYFLTALKHADFMIGNSSAGVREAPYYGIPSINIGSRQQNRVTAAAVINAETDAGAILKTIQEVPKTRFMPEGQFGKGNSAQLFKASLQDESLWELNHQKQFSDL